MKLNRFMLAACSSGSGKTLVTCGMLRYLLQKNKKVVSFKCGPDYIDPAFHVHACGKKGYNLDSFFLGQEQLCALMAKHGKGSDIAVIEGVMGYYDGIALDNTRASSCEVAEWTDTPVILIVNAGGMSRSILAQIHGFVSYQNKKNIKGIFLNQISAGMAKMLAKPIMENFGIPVVGSLPKMKDIHIESRHLGLMMPEEISDLDKQIQRVADELEKTVDLETLMRVAGEAPELFECEKCPEGEVEPSEGEKCIEEATGLPVEKNVCVRVQKPLRVAVARDEAFCFIYEDNLRVLKEHGIELVFFSPIHDHALPSNVDGMILYGGYPELYGKELSENTAMLQQIRQAIQGGLPVIAECGGFMYLHEAITDPQGNTWKMAGVLPLEADYKGKLQRFGYVTLQDGQVFGKCIGHMKAHEFHYYDSTDPGEDLLAMKPSGKRSWRCIHSNEHMFVGFPHLYYESNPAFVDAFVKACLRRVAESR